MSHFTPLSRAFIGVFFAFALLVSAAPSANAATSSFEISGWIPYWRTATGTADVLPHLSQLTEVNPFGYTVKQDGSLYDVAKFTQEPWTNFFAKAKAAKVRVIPTVMWSDTESIDRILRDPKLRAEHVKNIVAKVNEMGFDGVDIDYEGKKAETKQYYSAFLKELYAAMGKKWVMCTIEARTPVDSRYLGTPPADATTYANDFVAINKYCDRVRLMTYDQQFVDQKLVKANKGVLYAPVADPLWVEKVVKLVKKDIKASKLVVGIATYGYDYQVIPNSDGSGYSYTLVEAFNPKYALDTAAEFGITPTRNAAGEMSFSYVPSNTPSMLPSQQSLEALAPSGTTSSYLAAAGALALQKNSGKQAPFHVLWWSDSKAIADKVALAKKLGVRGVAVFKFDGGADPLMWSVLKK
ncbi:MAG: putative peptidoglycan hydrolase YvbX, NOT involved in spore germination [Parcubacteria bacterium C7867-001]|nr:MAG: putative peptidoglycan hydrolase YvbX, NOT involved in spore germination [Parcubacteria bacterium C7867-001]